MTVRGSLADTAPGRDIILAALLSAVIVSAAGAADAPDTSTDTSTGRALNALMAEYWDFSLAEDPVLASRTGAEGGNDRLPGVTPADLRRRLDTERRFHARVRDIDMDALGDRGRLNAGLFEWVLNDSIGAYELGLERIPFNTFSGFFMNALTASNGLRMDSVDDYEDYLSRLRDIPRYFDENLANMGRGSRDGFVLPRIVIEGVLPTLQAQVKEVPEESSFYEPFRRMHAKISEADQERLRSLAKTAIADDVMPAFARVARYLDKDYEASESIGAALLPEGGAYYAFQVRRYTTLPDLGPDEIHRIGLDEVRRIRAEMDAVIQDLEFDGDFKAFAGFLRTDPQFYARSEVELLQKTALIAKRIDYVMPGFFGYLPRQPYGVVPVPDEIAANYTTGAYNGAPAGGVHGGAFWVNTHALDQRPLYELPALTLHEAVPGHHHQNAVALEMQDVPAFRKDLYFSAFGEGWGLYSEKLGVEMGIYQTPYEHFGRLSYEMWRACRLVIDTGIHSQGWSRQQALDYMTANTSLSQSNIRAEIDRYISWPGQALAYKLGELRIQALRAEAEELLGDRFDLREFHDLLLRNGALPLAMLEAVVDRYLDTALTETETRP